MAATSPTKPVLLAPNSNSQPHQALPHQAQPQPERSPQVALSQYLQEAVMPAFQQTVSVPPLVCPQAPSTPHHGRKLKSLALAALLLWGGAANAAEFPQFHRDFDPGKAQVSYGNETAYTKVVTGLGNRSNYQLIWQNFDVGAQRVLKFGVDGSNTHDQVSFLNVVKGGPRSVIAGEISPVAGGPNINFYLINPNGITLEKTGRINQFNQVYLGTEQVSSQLLQQAETSTTAISLDDLKLSNQFTSSADFAPGMGKVRLLGYINADHLTVNGSQIIISDFKAMVSTNAGDDNLPQVSLPDTLLLNSSTNRIDIGGTLDEPAEHGTYREYLAQQGLKAAAAADTVKASLEPGEFIDHSAATAITSVGELQDVAWSDPTLKLWLANNLSLDERDYAQLHEAMVDQGFSGQVDLDGAFNAVSYEGVVEQGGSYGLFTELNGAHITNLKLYGASLELSRDFTANGLPLKVGALAGAMSNSTLHNVEVSDFNFTFPRRWSGADQLSAVMVGGLAGSIDGTTALTNVTAGLGLDTLDALEGSGRTWLSGTTDVINPDGLYYGHLAGTVRGSLEQHGVVAALAPKEWPDGAAWGHADDGAQWQIAPSFQAALAAAEKRGEGAMVADYYAQSGSGDELELALKGFLKPFFIHDYNFRYAGQDVTHNYGELTDAVNAGFDLSDYFTLSGTQLDGDYAHAGCYEYDLSNRTADELGENFYFTYAHAGNTWDESAGGSDSSAARRERPDGLLGTGTLNINQKPITVDLGDQTITEGEEGAINLTPGEDTIDNYGEVSDTVTGLGDDLDDLGLKLEYQPGTEGSGQIVGSVEGGSGNYDVTFVGGEVTVLPKPEPEPEPEPTPEPTPDPIPEPDPEPMPEPSPEPMPEPSPEPMPEPSLEPMPEPSPEPMPQPQLPELSAQVSSETKCENCGEVSSRGLVPSWTRLYNQAQVFLGALDYTKTLIASWLSPNAAPEPDAPASELAATTTERTSPESGVTAPQVEGREPDDSAPDSRVTAQQEPQNHKPAA